MLRIIPGEIPQPKFHQYLLGCVSPRPISFVSTMDVNGNVNLAPFSFFNAFGSNPPVLIFSPAVNGRTQRKKDTLQNLKEVGECVVNIVSYDIIHQCNLASTEFEKGVDEFEKAGFTKLPSEFVKPPRVAESKAHLECKVMQIIETGNGGGAANLIICEVLAIHVSESVLDDDGFISPFKFDQVGRISKNYWIRVVPDSILEMPRAPRPDSALGFDGLPSFIRTSAYLSGNDIALLANNAHLPLQKDLAPYQDLAKLNKEEIAAKCKALITESKLWEALCVAIFLE